MTAMIRALTWEVFFKNRVGLIGILLIVPMFWLFSKSFIDEVIGDYVPVGKISFAIMLISVLFLFAIFSYVDVNSKEKINEGFPPHLLRLPLPTWVLSVVPILLGTLAVSSFILLWINFFSDIKLSWLMQLAIISVAGSFISWSQATNWGLNTPTIQKAILLISIISALIFSVIAVFDINQQSTLFSKTYGSFGLIFLLMSGYYFCFLTLVRTRQNESFQIRLSFPTFEISRLFSSNSRPPQFSNGLWAQYWYEWKMQAFAIPLIIGLIAIVELGAAILGSERKIISIGFVTMFTLFLMSAHFMACNKLGGEDFSILPHCATRPLSDFDLAMSKLHPLAIAIFVSYLLFVSTPFLSLYIIGLPDTTTPPYGNEVVEKFGVSGMMALFSLVLIIFLAIFWAVSANGCAILLRDSKLIFFANIAAFIGLGVGLLSLMVYFKGQPGNFETALKASSIYQVLADSPHLIPLTFTGTIISFITFLMRPFQRVAKFEQLKIYAVISSVGLLISLGLLWSVELPIKVSAFASYSIVNLFLLCFLPFLIAPINVSKNRHR